MKNLPKKKTFPLRQIIWIGLTITVGLALLGSYLFGWLDTYQLTGYILIYCLAVPVVLLTTEALCDLDNKKVWLTWLVIGVIQFIFYILTYGNTDLVFSQSRAADLELCGLENYITDTPTSSLKTLLIFLLAYAVLNRLMKIGTGNFLVNTFRQLTWKHDRLKRQMNALDVIFNMILFAVIGICILTR